jgi:excisionase family DNA binding protein
MEKLLLSIGEFSEACNISRFTTRRLIDSKALRSIHVSRRVLIPRSELDRVLAEGCGPTSQAEQRKIERA